MEKNAKNFAIWTALQNDCHFFSSRPSYYGGAARNVEMKKLQKDFCVKHNLGHKSEWEMESAVNKFVNVSQIDWNACSTPESSKVDMFNGTEADSTWEEIVYGTLVLKTGDRIPYYAECKLNMDRFESVKKFFEVSVE